MMQIFLVILTAVVALSAGQRTCQTLERTAGRIITLKTNADIKQSDDLYIVWSFGPENQVKVEFKNGKLTKGDPNKFQLDLKTGALTIKSLSANDSGLYEGQIFDGGIVKGCCFNLIVGDPPKPPSVSVSPSGEIVEGSSVNLTCSSDANPAANYTWYKENEELPKASGQMFTITDFKAEDSGKYYCEAQNKWGSRNSTLHLNVVSEAEQSHHENLRAHQRNHTAAFVSAGLFGLTCIVLLPCAVWIMRKCQSKSPSPQNFCMVTTEDPPTVV